MKTRMMAWLREETVLVVSALLAAGSCLLVKPDEEYLSYFSGNMDTILILFCLMTVVAGLRSLGVFGKVDYSLLLTFLFFFVFIGNMNRYAPFRDFVVSMISGHETQAAILMSQVISNVPAALPLSNLPESGKA